MSEMLAQYESRIRQREIQPDSEPEKHAWDNPVHLKFEPNGEIKPYYGLTCITWIDPNTKLYRKLCEFQNMILDKFERAGLGYIFSFLEPDSFHMTICDISGSATPRHKQEAKKVVTQIGDAFSNTLNTQPISAQVQGIGLKSNITALVRFNQETELEKVLHLEHQIKQATQCDVRQFTGHITLAYCVNPTVEMVKDLLKILQPYQDFDFGRLTFSTFDLTCFTDMNTFIPLLAVDFANGQLERQRNDMQCEFCK